MIQPLVFTAMLGVLAGTPSTADSAGRALHAELVVNAPVQAVWDAWTSVAGIKTFFAPDGQIDPRVDGTYAIFFDPNAAPGARGADDMRILVFEPPRRLVFTWNAPVDQSYVRAQRTVVTIELEAAPPGTTRLRFSHTGWGTGDEWDRAYAYFDAAWNRLVLPRLVWRFAHGPIDWSAPPRDLTPIAPTLRCRVAYDRAGTGGGS